MTLFDLMFRSDYDRAALIVMAIGLAINAAIDFTRRGRGDHSA